MTGICGGAPGRAVSGLTGRSVFAAEPIPGGTVDGVQAPEQDAAMPDEFWMQIVPPPLPGQPPEPAPDPDEPVPIEEPPQPIPVPPNSPPEPIVA
jgi:hypothetical protein